jgi:hypothetical protein
MSSTPSKARRASSESVPVISKGLVVDGRERSAGTQVPENKDFSNPDGGG